MPFNIEITKNLANPQCIYIYTDVEAKLANSFAEPRCFTVLVREESLDQPQTHSQELPAGYIAAEERTLD